MRLSYSLQDLRALTKGEQGDSGNIETDRSYGRSKHIHAFQKEGISSFSKEKSPPSSPTKRKKWIRMSVCTIAFLLFLAFIFISVRAFRTYISHEASEYYVILDCGSTGTRVYVYKWSVDHAKVHTSMPIVIRSLPEEPRLKPHTQRGRAYRRMETEPGFDKLVHNETGLRAALQPLLQWAEKQIPKHAHKSTSLFLYATAGVRRLESSDSQWLLDKAWEILKNASFLCNRDWIKIISGMEEAYYGWIALNHHLGMLGALPPTRTYGSLDLGGSSLQVTFETEKPMNDDTSISLKIASASHHLSAYSLPGYGLNDAFDKSVAFLKRFSGTTRNGRLELKHPCLHTGYKEEYSCSHCAALNLEGSPMISGKALKKGSPAMVVELLGSPNWEKCSALAKATVNLSEWSNTSFGIDWKLRPCALGDSTPLPLGQFYAMSGFFVVFRFFNLTSEASIEDVLKMGQKFCKMTWEVAKNSVIPQPFIEQYCFRAPYIASLLRDGLHIEDNQVSIGTGSITWTLGVALLEAGQAFSGRLDLQSYMIMTTDMHPTILLTLALLSVLVLFCALLCVSNWVPRFSRSSYLPLFRSNNPTSSIRSILAFFRFRWWSSVNSGDGRTKAPLSPTTGGPQQHPFGIGYGLAGSNLQLVDSCAIPLGVAHSYSSGNLSQIQIGNGWQPHRGQTTLSSRRSSSREDLISSLAEAQIVKI